jgi:hypothetical protein
MEDAAKQLELFASTRVNLHRGALASLGATVYNDF